MHERSDVLHEDVFYPAHAPRTESEDYRAIRHKLIVEEDRPCFICGIKNSELATEKNTDGVKEMETHHWWVEWSLTNAVDIEKLRSYFGVPIEDLQSWVDHNPLNLLVLCDRHHRHKEVGIHTITYPIWVAQKFVKEKYQLTLGDGQDPTSTPGDAS